jgi:hypothetical protein
VKPRHPDDDREDHGEADECGCVNVDLAEALVGPPPRNPRIVSLPLPNKNSAPTPDMIPRDSRPLRGSPPIHWAARGPEESRERQRRCVAICSIELIV